MFERFLFVRLDDLNLERLRLPGTNARAIRSAYIILGRREKTNDIRQK